MGAIANSFAISQRALWFCRDEPQVCISCASFQEIKKQLKVQWSDQNEETIFAAPVEYVKVVLRPQGTMEAKSPAPESKGTDDCAAEASRSKWQALLGAAHKAHQTMTMYRQLRLIYDFDPMRPTEFTNLWAEAEERVKARQGKYDLSPEEMDRAILEELEKTAPESKVQKARPWIALNPGKLH